MDQPENKAPLESPKTDEVQDEMPVLDDSEPRVLNLGEEPAPQLEEVTIPKRPAATNVQQDYDTFSPLGENDKSDIQLALASDDWDRTTEVLTSIPNVKIDDTPGGREWMNVLNRSRYTVQYKGVFSRTAEREGSMFKQAVKSEKGNLAIGGVSFKDTPDVKLTGERAVLRVKALLGMGSIIQVPLWHSGFWITLKAPSEGEMLELNRRLDEEKISLGRATYGLAFSNNSVFYAGWVMDFAMNNLYDTTLKDNTNIRSKISSLDIPLIAWGLACVNWPRGFQYARAVLDGEQNKIIREKLNVGKLLWTDTQSLTPWQISHMAQRMGSTMTNEALERYRSEFTRGQGRTVELAENLSVTLRVPSMDQYLTSGQRWVNNIVAMVDKAFGLPPDEKTRDAYIGQQGQATFMRQFSHWVESIQAGSNTIDDVETIEQTIDALSSSDSIRTAYLRGVREFMEDATIALIAIPAADESEESGLPRFPHLLPLDALSTFFILLVQKVGMIQLRED